MKRFSLIISILLSIFNLFHPSKRKNILLLIFYIFTPILFTGCATHVIKMPKTLPDIVATYKSVTVPAGSPGMFDTGVSVKKGDYITIIAKGEIDLWPKSGSYVTSPYGCLLIRFGKKANASTYGYSYYSFICIYEIEKGNIYLGYRGSDVDSHGEALQRGFYSDDTGFFSVDIIVWKKDDPVLISNFLEEIWRSYPENVINLPVSKMLPLLEFRNLVNSFKNRKDTILAENKLTQELEETKKAISTLQGDKLVEEKLPEKEDKVETKVDKTEVVAYALKEKETKPVEQKEVSEVGQERIEEVVKKVDTPEKSEDIKQVKEGKKVDQAVKVGEAKEVEKSLQVVASGEKKQDLIKSELAQEAEAIKGKVVTGGSEKRLAEEIQEAFKALEEKEILLAKDREKERQIVELKDRLNMALLSLKNLEEMKKKMEEEVVRSKRVVEARIDQLEEEKKRLSQRPPVVVIASPKSGVHVESECISLSGVVEDDLRIIEMAIWVNNRLAKRDEYRRVQPEIKEVKRVDFSERICLREGRNEIVILAQDEDGLTTRKSVSIQYSKKKETVWAVVVGVNKYRSLPTLKYAVNDAREFYNYLVGINQIPKEQVSLIIDEEVTLDRLRSILGTYLRQKAGKNDMVIVYFAGHGATEVDPSSLDGDGLEKYILPYHADPKDLYATALPMNEISKIFQRISSENVVFIGDTCYSGASGGRTVSQLGYRANVSGAFLDRLSQGKGRVILTASDANEVSIEKDELRHGVFTYYLLEALRGKGDLDGDGLITVDEVHRYVSIKVPQSTDQRQHPVKKGEMKGQIVLGIHRSP